MRKLIWMSVIVATAFGAAGVYAGTPASDDAPAPGMKTQCPNVPGPRMDCPMGPFLQEEGPGYGMNPGSDCFDNQKRPWMGRRMAENLPEALKTRMEGVRSECRELRELWTNAVAARGEKSIEDLRKDFARDNAAAIAKMKADAKALADDLRACREGFDPKSCPNMGEDMPAGFGAPGVPPPYGNGQLRSEIETDVVTRINALKEPLTVETYSKIVREVMVAHRGDFAEAFRNHPGYGMGPMAPNLAHMREAMGRMRDASWMEKRQFRSELRAAMKIEDAGQREEAVRKVLQKYSEEPEEPAAPAPDKPAKQMGK